MKVLRYIQSSREEKQMVRGFLIVMALSFFLYDNLVAKNDDTFVWRSLKSGPYSVGFQQKHLYDYSRTFKPKYLFDGKVNEEEFGRPVQISIWYPAVEDQNPIYMTFGDYILSAGRETEFEANIDTLNQTEREEYYSIVKYFHPNVPKEKAEELFNESTKAIKLAKPLKGEFPLVMYASSYTSSPNENVRLFEYLASHGYIVAAIPCVGKSSHAITLDLIGVEAQVRDMEFAIAQLREFPGVNIRKIGALGFSYGGLSNVLLALRNSYVDAVVVLDGAIKTTLYNFQNEIQRLPIHSPSYLRAAFLLMSIEDANSDYWFYDGIKQADAYLLKFKGIGHQHFASYKTDVDSKAEFADEKAKETFERQAFTFEIICRYTRHFLDAYLKDNPESMAFLGNSLEENGITDYATSIESKRTKYIAPTEEQLCAIIKNEGIAKAKRLLTEAVKNDSGANLYSETFLVSLGWDGNIMLKKETLDLISLATIVYPESGFVFYNIGRLQMIQGNREAALDSIKKAVALNPESEQYKALLRILGGN